MLAMLSALVCSLRSMPVEAQRDTTTWPAKYGIMGIFHDIKFIRYVLEFYI